jgi:hypothetical protein
LDNPDLYDPKTPNNKVRENIFLRIRAPVQKGDKANEALRDKQAYMPRLGGDNGKCTCLHGIIFTDFFDSGDMPENSDDDNYRNWRASQNFIMIGSPSGPRENLSLATLSFPTAHSKTSPLTNNLQRSLKQPWSGPSSVTG